MKKLQILGIVVFGAFLFAGCDGGNLFSGSSDKSSDAAKTDENDFNFITGKCAEVVAYLESKKNSGIALTSTENYQYSNAVLECSGFNMINGINSIFTNGSGDIYGIISDLFGTNTVDPSKIKDLTGQYDKVLATCDTLPRDEQGQIIDKNMASLCGLAAASNTILEVSDIIMSVPGGPTSVEISETGMSNALNGVNGTDLNQGVADYVTGNGGDQFLNDLDKNLGYVEGAASEIGNQLNDPNFSNTLNDFTGGIKDANGSITSDSLANYINGLNKNTGTAASGI